ncbi:uncharacterized protein LOC124445116 [Xenia sp. Carnegie-2017]|uniref:uncharacterized protein LOC124445116 n=1 Tax=Xenia sp. Carnegie-2017 TaxID=2897299 RepID=UPI001F040507|nr:uncharacterized protein LOC124445116 [Xenia sp. Carnegie-2017]
MAEYRDVVEFLTRGFSLFDELHRNIFTKDNVTAEVIMARSEEYLCGLCLLSRLQGWTNEIVHFFADVIMLFQNEIAKLSTQFSIHNGNENDQYVCPMEENEMSSAGRPRFFITKEQIDGLRSLHFSWKKIAAMLNVSERTIRRRRKELRMEIGQAVSYSDISDEDLDANIEHILNRSVNSGERMVFGALKGFGLKVQREKIRNSIRRVDPVSRELRKKTSIHRRTYNVTIPNALWHIDGNHKLIRWRFVIHGGVDGFSRTIVYLRCSTNNTSSTVFQLFLQSIQTYKCPRESK